MDWLLLVFSFILITTIEVKIVDQRQSVDGMKIKTVTKFFDVDKKKLQQLWQYATTMGLIKAHTRYTLQTLPKVEEIVFEQCAKDAKTVISMAKCAVRVFDAKEHSLLFPTTTHRPKLLKTNYNINFIMRPTKQDLKKIKVKPAESIIELSSEMISKPNSTNSYYYSASKQKWIKNPIQKQATSGRIRRMDEIMMAYETFLEEQRIAKKKEDLIKKQNEKLIRNLYGLPRIMRLTRKKREANTFSLLSSGSNVDFKKLASKYFSHIVAGNSGNEQSHLNNLRRLQSHYQRVEKCNGYFKLMNDENKRVFNQLNLGIKSETPQIDTDKEAVQNVLDIVNQFTMNELNNNTKLSFLSPRILSIFPDAKTESKNRVLSPTILSFQRDGFFSLPDLFEIVSSNEKYQQIMLEAIMDLSGAGTAVEKLLLKLEPEMKYMEEVQYPLVQKMSKQDINWLKSRRLFDSEQERDYKKFGIAHLNEEQLSLIYSDDDQFYKPIANLTKEQRISRIENEIRQLANEGKPQWPFWNNTPKFKRQKRAASVEIPNYPHSEFINGIEYMTLKPHAFANLINFGVSMEALVLSPHAFISEILRPEALKLDLLSPRAFIATVLSPSALIARILSPTAFRAEVLSPRALTAWVLSPEALVAEVLSPRFLEPRVLSPEALVIDVLSPGILAPHVLSSETIGVIVLSPNILSPRIASEEKMLIEVLSPHILGGPHSKEEHDHDVVEIGPKSEQIHDEKHDEKRKESTISPTNGHNNNQHNHRISAIRNHGVMNYHKSIFTSNPF